MAESAVPTFGLPDENSGLAAPQIALMCGITGVTAVLCAARFGELEGIRHCRVLSRYGVDQGGGK
ncbi:hypothetical protein ABZ690_15675 [Streptomyces sp. NPDC006967]|uniref:hypothetical protein n=1 Tax=unclassified Streptomyces TaxID=2593676 RepID=UPI000CD5BD9A|nr:hypothetical protein [Streptomyces sp. SM1]